MASRVLAYVAVALVVAPACHEATLDSRYEQAPCPFAVPEGARVDCGVLTLPENHATGASRMLHLPVAVYRSTAAKAAPDPIVWLVGGPGGRAHVISSRMYTRVVAPYIATRDFI